MLTERGLGGAGWSGNKVLMKFRRVLAERGLGGQGDREEQWWSGAKGASGQIERAGNASSKIAGAPLFLGGLGVDFGGARGQRQGPTPGADRTLY